MKRKLFIFIFLILPLHLFAQQIPQQKPNKTINGQKEGEWVLWYDEEFNPTNLIVEVQYYRKITFNAGKPVGKVYDYYKSGKLQWEGYLLDIDPDVMDGFAISYYENGNIQVKCSFHNDQFEGDYESYYENGQLERKVTYKNNKEEGKTLLYYDNGNLQVEGFYKAGERAGEWIWYKQNGKIENKANYTLNKEDTEWTKMNNKLMDLYEDEKYQEALGVGNNLLLFTKKKFGINHQYYGIVLNNIAGIYEQLGKYEKALPLYIEALDITSKTAGKEHPDYGTRLNNLANLYESMGQYDKALPLFLEALEHAKKYLDKNDPSYGIRLSNLAVLYNKMGLYDKALPLYQEALESTKSALGKDHPSYGIRLNNLGTFYLDIGLYEKALPLLIESAEITKKNLGTNNSSYAANMNNLAMLYEKMGQYNNALSYYQQAIDISLNTLGKSHPIYGTYLDNLAGLYKNLGQNENAISLYNEAIEIKRNSIGKDHPDYASSLNNLADLYTNMGRQTEALPMFEESLAIFKKTLGKNHPDYASALNNIAGVYRDMGEYEKALALYKESLINSQKNFGKRHLESAQTMGNIAIIYEKLGQNDKALELYQEVFDIYKTTYGVEHPSYGLSLNNLAGMCHTMGQDEKAFSLYQQGFANLKSQINSNFSFLSEKEKENFIQTLNFNFEIYENFCTDYYQTNPQVAAISYDIELLSKGLILVSTLQMRQSIENNSNPEVSKIYDTWLTKKAQLSEQYSLPITERNSQLAQWEKEAELMEKRLLQYSKEFGNVNQIGKTNWKDVQNKLQPNEVAIEFASFQKYNGSAWQDSTQYIALIIRKEDKQPLLIPLFYQNQFDQVIEGSGIGINRVNNLYRGSIASSSSQIDLTKLYDLVWKPIEKYLKDGETIYFAPAGTLNQIAFAAIVTPDQKYLSDKYTLKQLSTTAQILSNHNVLQLNNLALFGGINYDASSDAMLSVARGIKENNDIASRSFSSSSGTRGETWDYLQGTLTEVQNIKGIAEKKNINIRYFVGTQALEEQFKAMSGKNAPSIIHIATHGFFFPDPAKNKDKLQGSRGIITEENQYKISEDPLNRSGLLFAGANHAWKGEKTTKGLDDGILTSYEASNISLPNTQLVVLSACETGLGDIKGSEGVYGLQRSFKIAGAKYLLMSLWQVPDKETAEFMQYFYGKLFAINNIEESFALTQKYMKAKYPNEPYKWAAFVLVR
ncbi:MAG: tetratricopeptide repeat protein [Bacteroidetes bacterium]|nr:tetratricopeptide repeat protein [Bacteroidota bacterium]